MKSLFSLLIRSLALGLGAVALSVAHAAAFDTITPAQPSDTPGKIEVLEFFSYSCPHCARLEPMLEAWEGTLPDGVVLKRVPVAFNASMRDQQTLYYALQAIDRLDLHAAVFKAIHQDRKPLNKADDIIDWVVAQGVDREEFTDVFQSFGVETKIKRADELREAYDIDGTPSLAVDGRYVTSPSHAGSYQGAIDEADKLVKDALATS